MTTSGDGPVLPVSDDGQDEAELEDRRQRVNRATRGVLAAVLCLEAFVVLLVPRAIAQTSQGLSTTKTLMLVALAVVLVCCGFLLRRPWGIGLGSVLQLVLASTVVLIPALAVVVVMFLLVWLYVLRTRRQLVGTPSGWRMLVS
jgi:FtsH-binding integral membrane protein